ncbi:MAG: acetolactate synthase small subunit [Ornithinimicrobium sp.]|uniref:acetolactate synthase small subunit n=1 Tax=Ornithinimicrobium sp. TaxID=1977084 RepID=UPI0026DECE7E|nr:acetolactate synthase small subunit [Ornithinimicrobium sp.]MDO5739953.1 acetolactate synthase small subunit [Ornithinimicrobium sp.]
MTLLHDYPLREPDVPTAPSTYRHPTHSATDHLSKGTTMTTTTPPTTPSANSNRHALSVLVENNPGVLARVSVLFARRNFNIDHLVVGPTEDSKVSRMTIVVNVSGEQLHKVTSQLDKLVEVIHIEQLADADAIRQQLWAINDNGPRPVGAMAAAAF